MSLYRGAGGASDATNDSTVNAVAGYASAAASSASAAATSATEASNSATASASSASSAATSATSVAANATNASSSAALAGNYAALANISKENAAASAAAASTKAGEASTSSSNAATSASTATTQAINAANSATAAAGSATSAASSASSASASAASALAIYGNTTAMNNAVTAAATSATNASTYAANANDSRVLAEAAVTGASSFASSAQASSNNAQAYANAALSARDATFAAYDSFDDRYLGVKSADPTVDNDGNPLIAGTLYFNDQTNMMMLRAGNAWVAAYTSGGSPSFGNTVVNGTLNVTGATTLSGGTANGVAYLNGSKVLTTGTALTFDGTNFATTGTATASKLIPTGSSTAGNGMYLPAANILGWSINGAEAMRLDGNLLIGTTTNTNSSKLVVNGTISETVNSIQYLVASQYDVGTAPNKIPLNQYLGNLAYQDAANIAGQVGHSLGTAALPSITFSTNTNTGMWSPATNTVAWSTNGSERMRLDASGIFLVGISSATGTAKLQISGPLRTTGYTVATLPAGTVGMRTYVTDALAPSFGATVVGGGAVTIPVFYNGTNWIVA